ncbi:MAG: nucleotidyl transferase AbiEii/AbiGii toxin family protein [Bacteroidota bacterium]
MIHKESHTIEWISQVAKANRNADKILIEKVVKALSLLEQLKVHELDFIFKGGTALMLLLPTPKRLSIDIDIILPKKTKDIDALFNNIIEGSEFTRYELNERKSTSKIDKEHYKFYYKPVTSTRATEEYILLDILYETNPYGTSVKENSVNSSFLKVTGKYTKVAMPTYEAILGDKLTAFAPNTTGVQYGREKEIEIIKQLYDIGHLFDVMEDLPSVKEVFDRIAKRELQYRESKVTAKEVLEDIYETSLCISTRGMDGKGNFEELQTGVQNIVNYIFSESFFIDKAITHASKAAYLSALISTNAKKVMRYDDISDIAGLLIDQPFSTKLNKLRKSNAEAFFYWYHTAQLMK